MLEKNNMNLNKALVVMQKAAFDAGCMLLQRQSTVKRLESRKDFLTDTDLKSEEIILRALLSAYPSIPSYSEEKGGTEEKEGYLWVIDPVDGTINFFLQDDNWGISIALVENSLSIAGVIYLPARKQMFVASKDTLAKMRVGKGKWRDLSVSKDSKLADSQFWLEWGKEEHGGDDHEKVYEVIKKLDRHSLYPQIRNSATADLMKVAQGKIAGLVFTKPEPFDVAAAGLIIERAGGVVTEIHGGSWSSFSKSLVASNGIIHNDLLRIIMTTKK